MSTNFANEPGVPPLTTWIQDSISALYKATTAASFNAAFDALLHDDAQIYVNGTRSTRDEYKRRLQGLKVYEQFATVTFANAVEVPIATDSTGSVGVFYKVALFEDALVQDSRVANVVSSSLNAIVARKPNAGTKVSTLTEVWMIERVQ